MTTWDCDIDLIMDTCIKSFQGALESAVSSLNKRTDDLIIRHLNILAELNLQHTMIPFWFHPGYLSLHLIFSFLQFTYFLI